MGLPPPCTTYERPSSPSSFSSYWAPSAPVLKAHWGAAHADWSKREERKESRCKKEEEENGRRSVGRVRAWRRRRRRSLGDRRLDLGSTTHDLTNAVNIVCAAASLCR